MPQNVILIMSDEHNPSYSSIYDDHRIFTPHLAKLAKKGTTFSNAYTTYPLCVPSRIEFLFNKRSVSLGINSNCVQDQLIDNRSFLKDLTNNGVHTVGIGKFDIPVSISDVGFDEYYWIWQREKNQELHRLNQKHLDIKQVEKRQNAYGINDDDNSDYARLKAAQVWLSKKSKQINKPWLLCIFLKMPHQPFYSSKKWWDFYANLKFSNREFFDECDSAKHPYAQKLKDYFQVSLISKNNRNDLLRGYIARISLLDEMIGRLINTVCTSYLEECTNIIYTSDHGTMMGKFGMWWKSTLYEDAIKIPCIVSGPMFNKDAKIITPVNLHHIRETIVKITSGNNNKDVKNLFDIVESDENHSIFAECIAPSSIGRSYMIRNTQWKYIHYENSCDQLFDILNDNNELDNKIEGHSQVAKKMFIQLKNNYPEIKLS